MGAPYTDNGVKISLSHSLDRVAVIASPENEVGIDIQHESPKIVKVSSKFCSDFELEHANDGMRMQKLHVLWAAKESIYKFIKREGLNFRNEIEVNPFEYSSKGSLEARVKNGLDDCLIYLNYHILEDYTLAYTVNP